MKEKIRYKWVYADSQRYFSINFPFLYPNGVEYFVDAWTPAPIGGLLVFDKERNARNFLYTHKHTRCFQLWRVIVKDKVPLGNCIPCILGNSTFIEKVMKESWEKKNPNTALWPKGTEAYKSVKLLNEVDDEE